MDRTNNTGGDDVIPPALAAPQSDATKKTDTK